MYIKNIVLENVGPINLIKKEFSFNDEGDPIPVILVGENGSGKSIFLSFIVNAVLASKQEVYEDVEVEKGFVYKLRSPLYIKTGENYYFAKVEFEKPMFCLELQLDRTREEFENQNKLCLLHKGWDKLKANETSHIDSNFHTSKQLVKNEIDSNVILYFPSNRYEDPAWLNHDNLIAKAEFIDKKRIDKISNRKTIKYSSLINIINWILGIVLDKYLYEKQEVNVDQYLSSRNGVGLVDINNLRNAIKNPIYSGINSLIHEAINTFLRKLYKDQTIRIGIKNKTREIVIVKDDKDFIPNIFNMSTGESLVFGMFCSILQDFDSTNYKFVSTKEIKGVVLIDEIDLHIHSTMQYELLPLLIKEFPKIQFIITTHSPLFLLGMEKELGKEHFQVINMPKGEQINTESFKEFEKAYSYFKESIKFQEDVNLEIANSHKALLFVEGDYDIRYLTKAAELLEKNEILNYFKLVDSDGHGNMTNVSKHFDTKLAEVIPQKILLLYDCDQNKIKSNKGNVYKRVMPTIESNPIKKGIENLFPIDAINSAKAFKTAFIDITPQIEKLQRGEKLLIPEYWEVNPNEKKNLCSWLVENGTKDDFLNFNVVFDFLKEVIDEN